MQKGHYLPPTQDPLKPSGCIIRRVVRPDCHLNRHTAFYLVSELPPSNPSLLLSNEKGTTESTSPSKHVFVEVETHCWGHSLEKSKRLFGARSRVREDDVSISSPLEELQRKEANFRVQDVSFGHLFFVVLAFGNYIIFVQFYIPVFLHRWAKVFP